MDHPRIVKYFRNMSADHNPWEEADVWKKYEKDPEALREQLAKLEEKRLAKLEPYWKTYWTLSVWSFILFGGIGAVFYRWLTS